MGQIERRLYKVLRNVGVKKSYIQRAQTIDDLYLDEYDQKLLVYYFEDEFNVFLRENEIRKLTSLTAVGSFLHKKRLFLN